MSVKRYGIYLFYSPTTDLRAQGLGRHLSAFLRSAEVRDDIRFAVACPSWMRQSLSALCEEEDVDESSFDVIAPARQPLVLELRARYRAFKMRPRRPGMAQRLRSRLGPLVGSTVTAVELWLVGNRSVLLLILFALLSIPVAVLLSLGRTAWGAARRLEGAVARGWRHLARRSQIGLLSDRLNVLIFRPSLDPASLRLARLMEKAEIARMHRLIRADTSITAWYCPTPFWPHFAEIEAPRLMCVPDVVQNDFAAGYALANGNAGYLAFREVEAAIARCDDFVTYSEHVKWHTLVDHHQIEPHRVSVVRHGANRLDDQLIVRSKDNQPGAADAFARALLREALHKSVGNRFVPLLAHAEFKFLFYASQFRPNKNIITLLRAFDHLLKRRYCGHKLILTGDPTFTPDIADFIQANNLENDVLCLHGLSIPELAACYRLADLAINPSLSEGGFPFTFSEALSVDTPVVMADIAVTAEVIGEADFYAAMTFDPYDWRSAAERIDWALEHLEDLRSCQRAFYQSVLIGRKWANVVDDYVAILDRISTPVH